MTYLRLSDPLIWLLYIHRRRLHCHSQIHCTSTPWSDRRDALTKQTAPFKLLKPIPLEFICASSLEELRKSDVFQLLAIIEKLSIYQKEKGSFTGHHLIPDPKFYARIIGSVSLVIRYGSGQWMKSSNSPLNLGLLRTMIRRVLNRGKGYGRKWSQGHQ
jgi:hypothetical protein